MLPQIAARFVKKMLTQGLRPEQIVILSVHSTENSALSSTATLADLPVAMEPAPGKIWFTSVRIKIFSLYPLVKKRLIRYNIYCCIDALLAQLVRVSP